MQKLKLSLKLQRDAQDHADRCVDEDSQSFMMEDVGENRFLTNFGINRTADFIVNYWVRERSLYNYRSDTCSGECRHYKQVVRAETKYVGCGSAYCSNLGGQLVVCKYTPRGRIDTQPYKKGERCSECPDGYRCDDGLCTN